MKITVTGKDDMKSWHLFGRQAVSNSFSILSFKRKASHQATLHCTLLMFLAHFFERGFWTFLSTSQHFINCFCLSCTLINVHRHKFLHVSEHCHASTYRCTLIKTLLCISVSFIAFQQQSQSPTSHFPQSVNASLLFESN